MVTRQERADAKLQKLAAELAMTLALRSEAEEIGKLAKIAGLPAGVTAGLAAHGETLLEGFRS